MAPDKKTGKPKAAHTLLATMPNPTIIIPINMRMTLSSIPTLVFICFKFFSKDTGGVLKEKWRLSGAGMIYIRKKRTLLRKTSEWSYW